MSRGDDTCTLEVELELDLDLDTARASRVWTVVMSRDGKHMYKRNHRTGADSEIDADVYPAGRRLHRHQRELVQKVHRLGQASAKTRMKDIDDRDRSERYVLECYGR